MKTLYENVLAATFLARVNRFVVTIELQGEVVQAHLPNPGRMWELLFPGVTMYVVLHEGENLKTKYRVIGIERNRTPIMLDTNYSNQVAAYLINHQQISGWEEWRVKKSEYTVGHSRFDLLLENVTGEQFLLEVKSCTLFSQNGAMFPDAVTERGRKHLLHLHELHKEGWHTGILFLVQWEYAQWFLPDYHTDPDFAETFLHVDLDWKAVAVKWSTDFSMPSVQRLCTYPKQLLERECADSGVYMMVLELPAEMTVSFGAKGELLCPKGYYVYVGSAKKNLAARIERHKRKRKKMHWHIDYFRQVCDIVAAIPIRTQDDIECELAEAVRHSSSWAMKGIGASDCDCESHLFGMMENPIHTESFMQIVENFRMNRLEGKMNNNSKH